MLTWVHRASAGIAYTGFGFKPKALRLSSGLDD